MKLLRRLRLVVVGLLLMFVVNAVAFWRHPVSVRASTSPIQHIVIMDKENHTFDNYFGTFPGANGATTYIGTDGVRHPLGHTIDPLVADIRHEHNWAKQAIDGGKMDKFSVTPGAIQNGVDYADSQYHQSDIPNYWQYAQHYALADNFFSSILGPSFANHLWSIAGANDNVDGNPGNQKTPTQGTWGCDGAPGTLVETRSPTNVVTNVPPCFDDQTLGDTLDHAGLSWKYYAPNQGASGYGWSAYDAIQHIRFGPDWQANVVNYQNFLTDAQSGMLPKVSWLVQPVALSEHAPQSVCNGENWTVQQINAIENNPALAGNTLIILTWDDWGGFYDHVQPPKLPYNPNITTGLRVPAIFISPYTKAGTVDHNFYTFSSMLKAVEQNWNLPALTTMDGTANSILLSQDFAQAPRAPLVLPTRTCAPVTHAVTYSPTDPDD